MHVALYVVALVFAHREAFAEDLQLLILHNNDLHSRFEEVAVTTDTCSPEGKNNTCVGGFARTAHEIRRYRKLADEGKGRKVLYLNAGDTFIGTIWYNVHRWKICADFLNALQPDVICLGNHEFDEGLGDLVLFAEQLRHPITTVNFNVTGEPALQIIKRSVVLEIEGRKVGVIGYLTKDTNEISRVKPMIIDDEIPALIAESEKLDSEGVKIIIGLGHAGYTMDKRIARDVPLIDVVVGGHSNTFLWNGPKIYEEEPQGPYPTVIEQKSGKKVPIVQAYAYSKYLGRLNVTFDENGDLIEFGGQPEYLGAEIVQDDDILELLEKYRPEINRMNEQVIAQSKVFLDGAFEHCRSSECNFGNLVADALVYYVAFKTQEKGKRWTSAPISIYNSGNFRSSINVSYTDGNITRAELYGALPYINDVIAFTIKGSDIWEMLEFNVQDYALDSLNGALLQVSGLKIVYDLRNPVGRRVISVKTRCGECTVPKYEPLNSEGYYTILSTDYLINGGDGFAMIRDKTFNHTKQDLQVLEMVEWYIQHQSPIYPEVQGRLQFRTGVGASASPTSRLPEMLICALVLTKLLIEF